MKIFGLDSLRKNKIENLKIYTFYCFVLSLFSLAGIVSCSDIQFDNSWENPNEYRRVENWIYEVKFPADTL